MAAVLAAGGWCPQPGFAAGPTESRRTAVVRAVEKVGPSVVNISAEEVRKDNAFSFFGDPLLDEYFQRYFERPPSAARKRTDLGSGVIIRQDGHLLTNHHVVARADKIVVTLLDGTEHEAGIVGSDPQFDLAVLKIEGVSGLPEAGLGDSDELMTGETVIAIGNPFGLSHTVTSGVVSAVRRSVKGGGQTVYHDFIQTDASINPGNSGGPLVNVLGEVVGINTAIVAEGQGIGFAIPINMAKKVMRELIVHGRVSPGWLGVFVQDLTDGLRESFGYRRGGGVLVSRVVGGTEAGARPGDIIVSADGREVEDVARFAELASAALPGDRLKVAVLRDGRRTEAQLACRKVTPEEAEELAWDLLGVAVEESRRGLTVTRVRTDSYAARIGVEKGDLLVEVNDNHVQGLEELTRSLPGIVYRRRTPVKIQRGRFVYSVTLLGNI